MSARKRITARLFAYRAHKPLVLVVRTRTPDYHLNAVHNDAATKKNVYEFERVTFIYAPINNYSYKQEEKLVAELSQYQKKVVQEAARAALQPRYDLRLAAHDRLNSETLYVRAIGPQPFQIIELAGIFALNVQYNAAVIDSRPFGVYIAA